MGPGRHHCLNRHVFQHEYLQLASYRRCRFAGHHGPCTRSRQWTSNASPADVQAVSPQVQQKVHAQASSSKSRESEVLIEVRNVHKAFGSHHVLRGASFKIYRGEAVGIIGGSGTGKSTVLRLMAGLLQPDQGEVYIKGELRKGLLADNPDMPLSLGLVFQNGALFDSLTVRENVGFMLYEHSDLSEAEIELRVADSLAKVGLHGIGHIYPAQLSGGMRKRVAFARAIVHDSDMTTEQVIMYDEPTAGLDPVASTVIEDLMRSVHSKPSGNGTKTSSGITSYIVVTHQHSTIKRAVDRLVFLHEGRVVWQGSVDEFDTTDEPIVRQFATGSLKGPLTYT